MATPTSTVPKPQKTASTECERGVAGQVVALGVGVEAGRRQAGVREQLRVHELRLDDQPGRRAEPRVTGGQRQDVGEDVVDHVGIAGGHDEAPRRVVDEDPLQCREDDGVAHLHRVEVVERVAVGGAMAGDRGVAALPWHRCADVVPRSLAQVRGVGPLHHDLVDADDRDAYVADRLAFGRRDGARRGDRGPRRDLVERRLLGQGVADLVAVGLLLQLGAQPGLGTGLLIGGAPDLVRREQEQEDAGPDEDLPGDVDGPSHWGHRDQRLGRPPAQTRSAVPRPER